MAEKVRKIEELSEVEEPGQKLMKNRPMKEEEKEKKSDPFSEPDRPVQLDRFTY